MRNHQRAIGCLLLVAVVATVITVIGIFQRRTTLAKREIARIAAAGEPVTPQDLAVLAQLPAGAADATRAWDAPFARLRAREIGKSPFGLKILDTGGFGEPLGEVWSEYAAARAFIDKHQAVYADIDAALATPGECAFLRDFSPGYQGLLRHGQHLRTVTRLLLLRAYAQQQEHDSAGASHSLDELIKTSETLKHEPLAVSQLIRLACARTSLEGMQTLLPGLELTDEQLAELQSTILKVNYLPGVRRAVLGERVQGLTAFNDPGTADAEKVPSVAYQMWIHEDPLAFLTLMNEMTEDVQGDWPEPLKRMERFADLKDRWHVRAPLGGRGWAAPGGVVFTLRILIERAAVETARMRAAAIVLAAERFRLAQNRYPQSIEELVPQWLDAAPVDSCNGQPMHYKLDDHSVCAYSVGIDGRDDGGVEKPVTKDGQTSLQGTPDVVFRVLLRQSPQSPAGKE